MNAELANALIKAYPQVVNVIGDVAYDAAGNEVAYNLADIEDQAGKDQCKQTASQLLYATDWTTIADVANPVNTPYLYNQAEFIVYRNAVRKLAVNPVADPTFPTKPNEVWK